jgi:glycosyltransferase involved in cell wall biosynthesis
MKFYELFKPRGSKAIQPQSVIVNQCGEKASLKTEQLVKDGGANGRKLIFHPYWCENPYQKLLAEHLIKLGVHWKEKTLNNSLRGELPDILHLHWLHQNFIKTNLKDATINTVKFIRRLVILRLVGVKIVWTAHNLKDHDNRYPLLDRICTNLVVKLAHAIIAHSDLAKSEVASHFNLQNRDKIFVVPHGNYIDFYENKIERTEARSILGVPDSSICLLFLGSIRPYKGLSELLNAFKQLHADEVQLIIAGEPSNAVETERIREETSGYNNIKFIPNFIPDYQIQVYMNACDAVVFPYKDILTSGALLLAMSFARACIAPRKGCFEEILDDSGAFLYDPDIQAGLAQAIKGAIQQKAHLLDMGEHNRQLAEQSNWSRIAEMTIKVYQQCLSR